MNRQAILDEYKNEEERLLVAKVFDKIEYIKTRNKIADTDFLNLHEQDLVQKLLKKIKFENYYFFGGNDLTERKLAIVYPEKITKEMCEKNHKNLMKIIEIKLPNELNDEYDHKSYLGALMKLGLEREKIGDIITNPQGAEIIIKPEIYNYLMQNLSILTRFQKAEIIEKSIDDLSRKEVVKQEMTVIINSLRLDNIVSAIVKTSRSKAAEIIEQERVFVNFTTETKLSKNVSEGDIITVRGKGRFEFKQIKGNTKKGRFVIIVNKYL